MHGGGGIGIGKDIHSELLTGGGGGGGGSDNK